MSVSGGCCFPSEEEQDDAVLEWRKHEAERVSSKSPRDRLLLEIITSLRFYSGLHDIDRMEKCEDEIIDFIHKYEEC
jgi:hypothetical protein